MSVTTVDYLQHLVFCGFVPGWKEAGLYRRFDQEKPHHIHFSRGRERARQIWPSIKPHVPESVRSLSFS